MEAGVDYYKVLQVDPEAEIDVIQAAYRALARKHHPDVARTREASERMAALNAAWQVLRDPERKKAYDAARAKRATSDSGGGKAAPTAAATTPPPPPSAPFGAPRATRGRGAEAGQPKPQGTVLDFGRYAGWSLADIAKHDPGFLEWFVRMPIARPYVREINELLAKTGHARAPEPRPAPEPTKKGGLFRRR